MSAEVALLEIRLEIDGVILIVQMRALEGGRYEARWRWDAEHSAWSIWQASEPALAFSL